MAGHPEHGGELTFQPWREFINVERPDATTFDPIEYLASTQRFSDQQPPDNFEDWTAYYGANFNIVGNALLWVAEHPDEHHQANRPYALKSALYISDTLPDFQRSRIIEGIFWSYFEAGQYDDCKEMLERVAEICSGFAINEINSALRDPENYRKNNKQ